MKWFNKLINWFKVSWLKLIPLKRIPGELKKQDGIKKDVNDERDFRVEAIGIVIPTKYSLKIDPYKYVKNQGLWNSCGSHAVTTGVEISHDVNKTNLQVPLSERYHYYIARQDEFDGTKYMGTFPENTGMYSRTMLKAAQKVGITPEKLCPYLSSKMNEKPGPFAFGFSHLWKIRYYYRVPDIVSAKEALYNNQPVLIGLYMTPSFKSFAGSINPEDTLKNGGHEIVIYGFDDETKEFLCINSWGKSYKDKGCMRVPYEYCEKNIIDMWTFTIEI